jgi:hypothetical protein
LQPLLQCISRRFCKSFAISKESVASLDSAHAKH